jgi:8-oxo-dGTP pyrophosphatase MutT (NUDIX family)
VLWQEDLPFEVVMYLTSQFEPGWRFSSARAVVLFENRQVLVVRDPSSVHILPGGRIEADETIEQALRRELAEETGWSIKDPRPLGVLHYHHLGPGLERQRLPDFLQAVFAAQADSFEPAMRETEGHELDAQVMDIVKARLLPLTQRERLLLDAAILALGESPRRYA